MSHLQDAPERFPLSPYQLDLWVTAMGSQDSPQYNTSFHQRLAGAVDRDLLVACVEDTVRRNGAMRLRFGDDGGVPYQWFAPESACSGIELLDLSAEPDPAAACAQAIYEAQQRPLPLHDSPMYRFTLLVESTQAVHLHMVSHHLITDGWSLNEMITRILRAYAAGGVDSEQQGESAPSYRSFVETESAYRDTAEHADDLKHHRSVLDGVAPVLFPRKPAVAPRKGARHSFTIDGAWIGRIREAGLSVFPYTAAMLGTYLSRLHTSDEVVIGVSFQNRPGPFMGTIGHFANTLPLRMSAHSHTSVRALAAEAAAATRALGEHQRTALGEVLREATSLPAEARQLFDVTLSYVRFPGPATVPGLVGETYMYSPCHEQDALSVVIIAFEDLDEIRVDLDYATDVFDQDFPIEATAAHLKSLLEQGLSTPDGPLSAVPMLSAVEHERLLDHGRGPTVAFRQEATLATLFEEQADRHPDRIAVRAADGTTRTYTELDRAANQVARALRADGVGRAARVAVLMERGPDLLAALLGILKSGAAYVPIDPRYPAERVRFLLADSCPAAVLVSAGIEPPTDLAAALPVRRVADLLHGDGTRVEPGAAASTDLAYVIYTSGSTGRPKGVAVRHDSVVNRLAWMQRRYPLAADDVVLQKTPISFDVSVWELFWWAVEGASVALLAPGEERDPRAVARAVREHAVTVTHFVPSMLGPFLELARESADLRADVSTLRRVFCSGEALPAARVNQFARLFPRGSASEPGPSLVNLYGPTEATVDVTYFDCPAEGLADRVPIGRPIDNTFLYAVGRDGGLQPMGAPGELYIGGVGVAAGYLDRPELTEERFVPDRFGGQDRLYRTGDLVRWLTDGNLEYLGRLDDQVKIRGNRVELGEVADALLAVPGILDAIVVDRSSAERGVHLVAYYVADSGTGTDFDSGSGTGTGSHSHSDSDSGSDPAPEAALREHLARTLPDFMLPSYFVPVDRIPLTTNGKADRSALPAPTGTTNTSATSRPPTPTERTLAQIWAEVLGSGPVTPDDDYYALGGDSLLMLRIRALAEQRGLPFALADLVRHRTVAALADHIRRAGPRTGPDPEAPLAPFELVSAIDRARLGDAEDAYPLTRLQLGLIYHSRRHTTSAVYKDVFRYTLRVEWDEERFREAFAGLVRRHPALRSGFAPAGYTEPLQVVYPVADPCLELVDLRDAATAAAEAEIGRHIEDRRYHAYSFDRTDLYLARVHVLSSELVLVLSFHHALLDGASVANLVADLVRDYGRALNNTDESAPEPVPEAALHSAAAYVRAERHALQSPDSSHYWSTELDGCAPLSINTFGPHEPGPATDRTPASHRVELPRTLVEDMRALAREQSLPVKSLLFAAHCLTLRLFSGRDDVLTGLVTHGRPEQAGAERTLGLFLNTLPLLVDTQADSWLGVAYEAFHREQRAYPHRRYPLSAIQEARGGALFDTAFNYVRFRQLSEALTEAGAELADFQTFEQTNFALLVNAVTDPVDAHVWLRIDNDGHTVTDTQVRLFADLYARILDRIVHHPDEPPAWSFLAAEPARPAAPRPAPTIVDRFLAQAARTPQHIALAWADEQWDYARLAEASADIAANLGESGVGPGSVVGVAAERRPETIAVMLGVLRTGAAIMPLDTDYPPKRLAYMVRQANPELIVAAERYDGLFDQTTKSVRPDQLTAPRQAPSAAPAEPKVGNIKPDSLAAVLFTSGSTGRPKGVAMPHRTLATVVSWQNEGATACSGVTLQYAALSFDVSLQEIFSTLCSGGTLRMVPEEVRRDLPALLRLIDRDRVERIFIPYVALQQLAMAAEALNITPEALRVIVCGGEQLRITEQIRRLCSLLPNSVLENHYGPTETHVVTRHTLTGPPEAFPDLPPVGTPVDGADVRVLDAELRPVPPGVTGEIYIGGPSVALGYLGRADLTRERFVHLPSAAGLFYRSGDLGFVLPGGQIVCGGRADTQVKVRGIRVETAEVELAVRDLAVQYPGIQDVAVVAQQRQGTETLLVAFLTGDHTCVDPGALRSRLRETLPDHMVPSYVQWIERLPYTPSGKRDDASLRALPLAAPAGHDTTAPRTAHERALAEILADLLRLPAIGVHDNIFDLGGTSLTVMRLVVTIEERFTVRIPLADLIAAPTVAELAERLRTTASQTARFDPVVAIKSSGTRPPLFLVHPMGGNVLCFLPFAKHLPDDQPLYGLQSAGADPGTVPLGTIEEMAADYITALKRVQPDGPYAIGGFSFGGFVAFEIARRLRAAGEQVTATVLFDTVALNPDLRERYTDDALLGWFFWELLWPVRGGDSPLRGLPPDAVTTEQKFAHIAEQAVRFGVLPADAAGSLLRRLFRVYQANWRAALAYRPGGVTIDVTLLRAEQPLPDFLEAMHGAVGSLHYEATNGWKHMTSGHVHVVPVAGDHLSMMEEPRVAPLAHTVAALLRADRIPPHRP